MPLLNKTFLIIKDKFRDAYPIVNYLLNCIFVHK